MSRRTKILSLLLRILVLWYVLHTALQTARMFFAYGMLLPTGETPSPYGAPTVPWTLISPVLGPLLVMLAASAAATWAHSALRADGSRDGERLAMGGGMALALGIAALLWQVGPLLIYLPDDFASLPYTESFYALSGVIGSFVAKALVVLALGLIIVGLFKRSELARVIFEATLWNFHLTGVIWLIFFGLYANAVI
jgi:heme/copper-type cytochrome/quinol oxidase subunit 3